jgi:NADPH:quinone reductase-like Zn-dependent oxidoreductase
VTNPRFIGAYAEYAVAAAGMLAKKPSSLSYIQAASVPVIAVTAWQALFEHARLEAGQTVVIHGAAGNVGACAIQLAHHARLRSVATAGAEDFNYVRALGGDLVVDFRTQRFEDEIENADAVLDLVGGDTQRRGVRSAAMTGYSEERIAALEAKVEGRPSEGTVLDMRSLLNRRRTI